MAQEPGFEIKLRRMRHGIRQIELAQRLGIAPSTLSLIENGWKPVTDERAQEIASAIDGLASAQAGGQRRVRTA